MKSFVSMNAHNTCCNAAACSSAHILQILDTVILAVSIVILQVGLLMIGRM